MTKGVVKTYNSVKGYGFVTASETGEDFFFNFRCLFYEPCKPGDKVEFQVVKSKTKPGRLEAVDLTKI